MKKIEINELPRLMTNALLRAGVDKEAAEIVSDVYTRASYRGVGHHDVNDFVGRLERIESGYINPVAKITKLTGFSAIESYKGDNGIGEYCTYFATRRSMDLAKMYGIGYCTISDSNHFLGAAPYCEMADEEGFLTIVMSKSPGGISLPGTNKNIIGNNPFGYAAGHKDERVLLDICNAYSSYGKMGERAKAGESVPEYWGNDLEGNPTTDPNEILKSGLYMPMGEHKGFGMAIMIELFSAVIGGGAILNQGESETGFKGQYTQSALSIDVSKLMSIDGYRERVGEMVGIFRQLYPDIYIPGERSVKVKKTIEEKGYFELEDHIYEQLISDSNRK